MTAPTTPPDSAPPPGPHAWARPLHERHMDLLGDLAEEAREVARTLARRVAAVDGDDGLAPPEAVVMLEGLSRAYGRAGRAVRLTLMLRERLIRDLIAFDEGLTPDAGRDDRAEGIGQIVRIIVDPRDDSGEREQLVREGGDRLDREALERSLLSRPVGELVAMICKDAGLDGSRLAGEDWAMDAMSGEAVGGWPLAGGRAPRPPGDIASLHKASP